MGLQSQYKPTGVIDWSPLPSASSAPRAHLQLPCGSVQGLEYLGPNQNQMVWIFADHHASNKKNLRQGSHWAVKLLQKQFTPDLFSHNQMFCISLRILSMPKQQLQSSVCGRGANIFIYSSFYLLIIFFRITQQSSGQRGALCGKFTAPWQGHILDRDWWFHWYTHKPDTMLLYCRRKLTRTHL